MGSPKDLVVRWTDRSTQGYDPDLSLWHRIWVALVWLALLLLVFLIGMVLVPIHGAVVAAGQVGVESRVKRIAHPTGGSIAAIYVSNGDHVTKGQALLRFDDAVLGPQSDLSSLSVDQLMAQRARLDAERLGLANIQFPPELVARTDIGARMAIADETGLFNARRAEARGQRAQLSARILQYEKEISGYASQISALRRQQALIEPERQGLRELWAKGLVTISRKNQIERAAIELDGTIASLEAQIAQVRARIIETKEQLLQVDQTRRADAGTQAAAIASALNDQRSRNLGARDLQARTLIRAPSSGIVNQLIFNTIGDVVRPAETIMEIVPDQDRLLIEAAVSPRDIDQLRMGQRARIRFSAFSASSTPELRGTVLSVAPDRTSDPATGGSYYAARVAVDPVDLKRNAQIVLKPGMPAEVFIETGSRSMISYLTKPLRDQVERAFNDS